MPAVVLLIFLAVFICFVLAIFVGAPYLPTFSSQINYALELGELKKGQTLLELGCGDGKVLVAAAKKGINAIGYEINPILYLIAKTRSLKYRSRIKVIWGNYWIKDWPEADAVFVFLIQRHMKKLDKKCIQYPYKPVKLLSFAFKIPQKQYAKTKGGIYLYEYN